MIIDCFQFFNELDLLEGRLKYLYDTVDYFVIVESTHTHSGNPKILNYLNNISRYRPYLEKIIYLPYQYDNLDQLNLNYIPNTLDPTSHHWLLENAQRNHGYQALKIFPDDAVVLIGDLDEIPDKGLVKHAASLLKNKQMDVALTLQMFFCNNFNHYNPNWFGTVIVSNREIKNKKSVQWFRDYRFTFYKFFNGGWHLSYWGSAEDVAYKIKSFSHQEYNKHEYTSIDNIKNKIQQGRDIFNRSDFIPFDINTLDPKIKEIFTPYIKSL